MDPLLRQTIHSWRHVRQELTNMTPEAAAILVLATAIERLAVVAANTSDESKEIVVYGLSDIGAAIENAGVNVAEALRESKP